jgi:prepilin-type processing-associated H-X9-DG protein
MYVRQPSRPAFSLSDLLVLLNVVFLLALLAFPLVLCTQVAAQRAHCADRLKTLAQAMRSYEDVHGGLPPRRTTRPYYQGFGVDLLPFLGQEKLAQAYRHDHHFFDEVNRPIIGTTLEAFQCPAAPGLHQIDIADMTARPTGATGATSDYFLPNSAKDSGLPAALQGNQRTALLDDRLMPSSASTDGTSQTLLLFEMAGRPDHWIAGTKQAERKQAHAGWWGAWAAWNATQVWSYKPDGIGYEGACTVNCNNEHGLYSFHPGGAHAAFVDGSVRFLGTSLDRYVLFALVTRDGGEIIGANDF